MPFTIFDKGSTLYPSPFLHRAINMIAALHSLRPFNIYPLYAFFWDCQFQIWNIKNLQIFKVQDLVWYQYNEALINRYSHNKYGKAIWKSMWISNPSKAKNGGWFCCLLFEVSKCHHSQWQLIGGAYIKH